VEEKQAKVGKAPWPGRHHGHTLIRMVSLYQLSQWCSVYVTMDTKSIQVWRI